MSKLIVITREGRRMEITATIGQSVMEIVRDAGIDGLPALCGGCCSCATCHVQTDPCFANLLPHMSDQENDLLEGVSTRREGSSRLSCQIQFGPELDGLLVTIPPED